MGIESLEFIFWLKGYNEYVIKSSSVFLEDLGNSQEFNGSLKAFHFLNVTMNRRKCRASIQERKTKTEYMISEKKCDRVGSDVCLVLWHGKLFRTCYLG